MFNLFAEDQITFVPEVAKAAKIRCRRAARLAVHFSVVVATLSVLGCSGDDMRQPTYPVTGRVTLDGQPLNNATVVFHALDKSKFKWEELPQARTDDQGNFKVFTYAVDDGAPAAEYQVGIALLEPVADDGGDQVKHSRPRIKLPAKYSDPKSSGLSAKVPAQATTLPTFELSSR